MGSWLVWAKFEGGFRVGLGLVYGWFRVGLGFVWGVVVYCWFRVG